MSGALQAVFMNQRSFGPPPPGAVGSAYQGGFYAGSISTSANGVATHYLVVAPLSSGEDSKAWKNANTGDGGANSFIDGPGNTSYLVGAGSSTVYPAAHFCDGLTIGGYSDWYMPAREELEICYYNLKPTTTNNTTAWGSNIYAVPTRNTNYTAGTPAQTSAADFQVGGAEAFTATSYWASTQLTGSASNAWRILFTTGYRTYAAKSYALKVRGVRRVAV